MDLCMCVRVYVYINTDLFLSGHQINQREWYPRDGFSTEPQSRPIYNSCSGSSLTAKTDGQEVGRTSRQRSQDLTHQLVHKTLYFRTWHLKVRTAKHINQYPPG